jgi:hypothetical protein
MTQKRDTHVLQVVKAVRQLQSKELDFLDPKAEHGVDASAISEHTNIPVQRLRPLLTTMIRQQQVCRIEAEATRPRKSRSGQDSHISRKVNYYYVDPSRGQEAETDPDQREQSEAVAAE